MTNSLSHLLYSSSSIVQCLEISTVKNIEISRLCTTLEISRCYNVEVDEQKISKKILTANIWLCVTCSWHQKSNLPILQFKLLQNAKCKRTTLGHSLFGTSQGRVSQPVSRSRVLCATTRACTPSSIFSTHEWVCQLKKKSWLMNMYS